MLLLALIFVILGIFIFHPLLFVGIVLAIIGLVFWGGSVGGRRNWY